LDSVVFSLFAMNDVFDKYLMCPEGNLAQALQATRLRTDIVNELRNRWFVPASTMIQWRRMMGTIPNEACEERDVQEVNF
jgi:hypothetical protein